MTAVLVTDALLMAIWRRVDLRDVIKQRYGVEYHERYVGKLLRALGFSHISAGTVRNLVREAGFIIDP